MCGEIKGCDTVLRTSYRVVLILKISFPDFCTRIIYRVRSEILKLIIKVSDCCTSQKRPQNVDKMCTTYRQHAHNIVLKINVCQQFLNVNKSE